MMPKIAPLVAFTALLGLVIPISRAAEHQVTVGGVGILKYDPEFVNADPGDTVIFTFKQKNHTVTQSSLNAPCSRLADGFDSGFVPVPDNQTDNFTAARFTVVDTSPVWVYCRQANHCQQGMVFAVNPGDKFDQFKNNAVGNSTTTSASASASVVTVTATVTVDGSAQTTTYTTNTAAASASASASASSTGTSTASAAAHTVTVGFNGALTFSPNNLTAQVGEQITFQFTAKNHTATQSSFANPCTPLSQTSTIGQTGFDSGFMPVAANASTFPTFTVTVNDTAPIWVYCKQTSPASHCKAGMVFAVNAPTSGNTFADFLQNAFGSAASASAPESSTAAGSAATASGTTASAPTATTNGARSLRSALSGVPMALVALAVAHALL